MQTEESETQLLAPPAAGAQSEDGDEAKALDYRSVIHQKEKALNPEDFCVPERQRSPD